MKQRIRTGISLLLVLATVTAMGFYNLTAAAGTAPRVTYKIVSNSPNPTIARGSSFEADFAFYDDRPAVPSDIKITVTSPDGSITGLPKDALSPTGLSASNSSSLSDMASYYLNIPEANMRYVGRGPAVLKFKIVYKNTDVSYVQKTIIECQPTPVTSSTGKSDLVLQSYSLDRNGVKEGEKFTLNLVLKNNSDITNNHVTAVLDGLNPDEITVDGQLDTKTLPSLAGGATAAISIPMICNPKMSSKNYMLKAQLSSDEAPTPVAFNVFVPVTGTKGSTESGSSSEKPNASKPLIIIESYDYGGKPVVGGKEFNLSMRFKNTNTSTQIENLKITVSSVAGTDDKSIAGAFTPAKSSNTFFIAKAGAGSTFSEQIALIPKADATPNSYGVSIAFKYEAVLDGKREAVEATETISIPLTQPDRFEVNNPELQNPMYLGEPGQVNMNYVNKGKSKIFNVSVKLEGNFTSAESNSYIGNIDSGVGDTFQATLNPTAEGTLTGKATFSYEDANGNTKTIVKDFSCDVVPMDNPTGGGVISEPGTVPEKKSSVPPWMIWSLLGAAVLVAVVTILLLKKRKAKKLRMLEENDDYDDPNTNEGK